MVIDVTKLRCKACPAFYLRNEQYRNISRWEKLREETKNSLPKKKINLYILCESLPSDKFFYDKHSHDGLRYRLHKELVGSGCDDNLFQYLSERGILLVDCALCPLFKLKDNVKERYAATICLQRNTFPYLDLAPGAPIIAIFPSRRGFLRKSLPNIQNRIIQDFQFSKLHGLKDLIDTKLKISR